MNEKKRDVVGMGAVAAIWLLLCASLWLSPPSSHSQTERRPLAQFPEFSSSALLSGRFMTDFESYTLDQFPFRDKFRSFKAQFHYKVLQQKDNNGIYFHKDHAAKLEYPFNEDSLTHALSVFRWINETYLQESDVYFSIVPDKSYYLAQDGGYPAMDYEKLIETAKKGTPYADYVNLTNTLTADSYYHTDTHWRQEVLLPTANRLCDALGIPRGKASDYTATPANRPFYGVYYGQAALPMQPDTLFTMESALLNNCTLYNYETGKTGPVYNIDKLSGDDLYEVFLSGSVSLLRIDNPHAQTEKELILFRDSFGSSLAPLLVHGYKSITLVDIRYISSRMLDRFIDFHGQDVLFLYSTLVLNNSNQLQ